MKGGYRLWRGSGGAGSPEGQSKGGGRGIAIHRAAFKDQNSSFNVDQYIETQGADGKTEAKHSHDEHARASALKAEKTVEMGGERWLRQWERRNVAGHGFGQRFPQDVVKERHVEKQRVELYTLRDEIAQRQVRTAPSIDRSMRKSSIVTLSQKVPPKDMKRRGRRMQTPQQMLEAGTGESCMF